MSIGKFPNFSKISGAAQTLVNHGGPASGRPGAGTGPHLGQKGANRTSGSSAHFRIDRKLHASHDDGVLR